MNGLSKFLVDNILEESKQPILIDMYKVKSFLGKGYSSVGRDNEDNESSIPQGGEEDENLIALLDAMAVGNLDHKVFLDQYTRFDKYFGEEGDDREGGKTRLFKLLKHELELDDEVVDTIMTDYNYKDKDMEDEEYYEKYDNMAPDEEWKGPAGATKGVKYDDSEDDHNTVEDYLTANSEWLQKYNKRHNLKEQTTALFGGGFKPPTKGHLEVILQGLKENTKVNKLIIAVGKKTRGGITQDQSVQIWEVYKRLIPVETEIIPVVSPFNFYKKFLKENKEDNVYIFIGARKNNKKDIVDIKERSKFVKRYSDNVIPKGILTENVDSGTNSRKQLKENLEEFYNTLPIELTEEEKLQVGNILDEKFAEKFKKIKTKAKDFIGKLKDVTKREGKETGKLIGLIYKILIKKYKPTDEEKSFMKGQSLDLGRMAILTTIQLLPIPGTTAITAALVKLGKKYNFDVLPSPTMENINESSEDKILYAFDLDDTLITSKSSVIVTNPEQGTFKLTPAEYALYEPGPDDELDFSEFAHLKNPRVIKDNFELFSQILNKSSQLTGAKTIILTARQPEVSIDLEKFLEKKNLPQVTLHAVGSSDPEEKLKVVQDYIGKGFNKVRFYDDSPKNVELIKSLNSPEVDVISKLVKHGPLGEILKEESDPFDLIQLVNEVIGEEEFDYEPHIDSLNDYMIKNEMNVTPLPSLVFIHDDVENAQDVMGKTAFYDPNKQEIVLYTLYRHPKDVLRSYAHEMIHHIQNLEDRLGNITTTDTREDDNLTNLESEAYKDGNLAFRKWTETLTEGQLSTLSLKKSFEPEEKDYKFDCNCG